MMMGQLVLEKIRLMFQKSRRQSQIRRDNIHTDVDNPAIRRVRDDRPGFGETPLALLGCILRPGKAHCHLPFASANAVQSMENCCCCKTTMLVTKNDSSTVWRQFATVVTGSSATIRTAA